MRIAMLADVHEDVEGLQAALSRMRKMAIEQVFFLGDISGFSVPHYTHHESRNASACLRLLREHCQIILAGNHDLHAARALPGPGTGFAYPENWYSMDYYEKLHLSGGRVWLYEKDELAPLYSKEDLKFLASLPEYEVFRSHGSANLLTHFVRPNLSGSLRQFFDQPAHFAEHFDWMISLDCQTAFCGHVHAEGVEIYTKTRRMCYGFRKKAKLTEPCIVVLPAIVSNTNRGGFLTYDARSRLIEAIRV